MKNVPSTSITLLERFPRTEAAMILVVVAAFAVLYETWDGSCDARSDGY